MGIFNKSTENQTKTPDEASLLKYIANLSPEDIDRLVDIAKGEIYNQTKDNSKSLTDYFELLKSVYSSSNFNSIGNTPHTRNQRYEIYDEMDESTAFISSALDILSDDATQADEDGYIIHIKSDSAKVTTILEGFISEFELEDRISKWARAIAKYGDLFINVDGEYGSGISYINDTIYPGIIDRRDLNGKLVAFVNNQNTVYSNEDIYAPWNFVHFRHKGDIYKEESSYARLGLQRDTFSRNLTSAYGQSILRPAIKVYTQLRFVENMMLLSRLTNSIRRNIFLINVGDVTPDKAFETISVYAQLLKKDINMNIEESMYSASKHTVNYDEDIFLPVGDPQNDVRIETIGGDMNMEEQYDLEYLLNKLFSALKVPKAYLNYEQDLNARSTLVQLDIRYARSVSQLQTTLISGLKRLMSIHLAYLGLDPEELDLEVSLTTVSAIDEEARIDQRQKEIATARDMWDLLMSMQDAVPDTPLNMLGTMEYIMTDYLGLDTSLVDSIFGREKEEDKVRVRSGRTYADFHAMYPNKENEGTMESLRETLMAIPASEFKEVEIEDDIEDLNE